MDKQKQIEEMAKETCWQQIYPCGDGRPFCFITQEVCDCREDNQCDHYAVCERIYNAGYRKIPEGAVVILEEEMEQFAETFAKSPQMQKVMYGLIKAWKKETAEEISNEIEDILQVPYKGNTDKQMLIRKGMTEGLKMALEICKEITEGK